MGEDRGFIEDHYFTAEPSSAVREREIAFMIAGQVFRLTTAAGVFSSERLDPGTAVLLRKAPLPAGPGGVHLDLGCGYGPIACVLARMSAPDRVYAVDVNHRALDLTRRNAEATGVGDRVVACRPEDVPADVRFDQIWSNPPIRVGKAELHALLLAWLPRLAPGGVAWLVVAKHLGADSLQAWLASEGYPTERHASRSAFRILRVTA